MNHFDNPPQFLKMHSRIAEIIHEMRQRHSSDDIATAVLVAIHIVETHETPSGADAGRDVGAVPQIDR